MNIQEAKAKLQSAKQKLKDVRQANLTSDGNLLTDEQHCSIIQACKMIDSVLETLPK